MLLNNVEYLQQIKRMLDISNVPWDELEGKSILVTGAAGMLGSAVIDVLVYCNEYTSMKINIYALGRTGSKIEERYGTVSQKDYFHIIEADIVQPLTLECRMDYIIHAASNANPYMYANYPVDTLLANVSGTNNLLEYARKYHAKRTLYVSSGEMYGQPDDTLVEGFDENYCGPVNYSDSRSCYPAGKRAAENLCQCYISQYGIEAVIVRPCHCYGPTQTSSDTRALSQFVQKVLNGEDIVLKSDGLLERTHCYVLDAVQAMYLVLLTAPNGEAYNIADNRSDASIRQVAEMISKARGRHVCFDLPDKTEKKGFSRVSRAVLNGNKLLGIGWKPIWELKEGIESTLNILENKEM